MSELPPQIPDTLYRGVIIPADQVGTHNFDGDLTPGSARQIDGSGRGVVADGNEYGVYMSDNAHMVDVAYATPRRGQQVPDSPSFYWEGSGSQSRLELPKVGALHQIDTKGIDIRRPFITPVLNGVYNNGFQGDEWIADVVPAARHRIIKFRLGPDTLHSSQEFELGDGKAEALEALRQEAARRSGILVVARERIEEIPTKRRHTPGVVNRALADLKTDPRLTARR